MIYSLTHCVIMLNGPLLDDYVVMIIDLIFVFFLDLEPEMVNKSKKVRLFEINKYFIYFLR